MSWFFVEKIDSEVYDAELRTIIVSAFFLFWYDGLWRMYLSPSEIDPIREGFGRLGDGVESIRLAAVIHDQDVTIMQDETVGQV